MKKTQFAEEQIAFALRQAELHGPQRHLWREDPQDFQNDTAGRSMAVPAAVQPVVKV